MKRINDHKMASIIRQEKFRRTWMIKHLVTLVGLGFSILPKIKIIEVKISAKEKSMLKKSVKSVQGLVSAVDKLL